MDVLAAVTILAPLWFAVASREMALHLKSIWRLKPVALKVKAYSSFTNRKQGFAHLVSNVDSNNHEVLKAQKHHENIHRNFSTHSLGIIYFSIVYFSIFQVYFCQNMSKYTVCQSQGWLPLLYESLLEAFAALVVWKVSMGCFEMFWNFEWSRSSHFKEQFVYVYKWVSTLFISKAVTNM